MLSTEEKERVRSRIREIEDTLVDGKPIGESAKKVLEEADALL